MKILLVRLSSLGDILHMFPAVSDLQAYYPEAEIHWLVEPAFAELAGWHQCVRKVHTVALRAQKKQWWRIPALLSRIRKQLRAEQFDLVVDAQGLIKSALLSSLSGAPVWGYHAQSARESLASQFYQRVAFVPSGLHIVAKNRRLIASLIEQDHQHAILNVESTLDFGLGRLRAEQRVKGVATQLAEFCQQPYVLLLHGTTWHSKHWPDSYWQQLASLLSQQGLVCLLPWGSVAEQQRALQIQQMVGEQVKVLPKTSLLQLVQLMLQAKAYVAVETGLGHLAAVLQVPGLMLHGPTDPAYSGILGQQSWHLVSQIDCSPCLKRRCPKQPESEAVPPCQMQLSPAVIADRLQRLLQASPLERHQQSEAGIRV